MDNIKQENPDANWGNLLTGIGILLLIAIFSISYFGRDPQSDLLQENEFDEIELINEATKNGQGERNVPTGEVIEVLGGEGLWDVAARACGDPEKYNYLAEANGLSIYSGVVPGQQLVVDCGPSE